MFNELILIHREGGQKKEQKKVLLPVDDLAGVAPDVRSTTPAQREFTCFDWFDVLAQRGTEVDAGATKQNYFIFKTCLRRMALVDAETAAQLELGDGDGILRGIEAYRFVLQVICGLRSPLIGETEVNGQFKLAVSAFPIPANPWGQQLKRFFQNLFEDARRIRQSHLVDLGSQSYGSVLRRELKGTSRVHILGAGHLVQEVLPWIAKDGTEVHIHCRNVEKAKAMLGSRSEVKVHPLTETVHFTAEDAFVIAAPVSSTRISSWLGRQLRANDVQPRVIADLRADSAEDRIAIGCRILDLSQVFNHIAENQAHLESRKAAALKAIDAAVEERHRYVEYRPFGWEDVCA